MVVLFRSCKRSIDKAVFEARLSHEVAQALAAGFAFDPAAICPARSTARNDESDPSVPTTTV